MRDMSMAESAAATELDALLTGDHDHTHVKSQREKIGDQLLERYMEILGRDASMMSRSPCALL